ncbi:MAG: energy-coupled thiamine transporter ThiT [Clostridiales bacterium]|nr:energy-coupled thiamine transporter ThiT [Clostridiales bacterium]
MYYNLLSDIVWYPILFDSPINVLRGVAFWLTIALAVAFTVNMLLANGDLRKKCARIWLIGAVIYACMLGVAFLWLTFSEDGIVTILFVPLLILILTVLVGAITLNFIRTKPVVIGVICAICAALLAVLVCMGVYYGSGNAEDVNGVEITVTENAALYICTILLLLTVCALCLIFGKEEKGGFTSKSVAFAGICIAMSFALSYIRILKLPQGGSITVASLLPLMIYSYIFGVKKGVFAGAIYGLLQAIQDPWIIHPAQFLLDYPVAFACIGVAGLFAKVKALDNLPQVKFALGAIVASVLRYLAHIFSGVFAFSEYAYDGAGNAISPWIYSLGYNSFVFIDIAIVIVAGVIIFSSKSFNSQINKTVATSVK